MLDNFDKYNNILCDYKITPNQFHLCLLIYHKNRSFFEDYLKNIGNFENSDIRRTIELGYISDFGEDFTNGVKRYDPNLLLTTPEFDDKFMIDSDLAFKQLKSLYPIHININNTLVTSMKCDSPKLKQRYKDLIKDNKVFHLYIVDILQKAKNHNLLNYAPMTFESFINSEHWEILQREMDEKSEQTKPKGFTAI